MFDPFDKTQRDAARIHRVHAELVDDVKDFVLMVHDKLFVISSLRSRPEER